MEFNSTHIKIIAFFVTSFFFLIEALIHYNMGKSGKFSFTIPEKKTICKILLIIFFFSFLSSGTMYFIEKIIINHL
tara:strand:- start:25 stop:252 length:228 start_codon:yes stop_codon:yes gene_type:complete